MVHSRRKILGFTLIELIVATAILAVLTGMAIPMARVTIKREKERELRHALHRPWSLPAPTWGVRLGSWLMRSESSLALSGCRCPPKRFLEAGFRFQFPELFAALKSNL